MGLSNYSHRYPNYGYKYSYPNNDLNLLLRPMILQVGLKVPGLGGLG